jgi:hypothetical protein
MNKVFQNGIDNGVEDMEIIDAKRIKEIEPFCEGIAGIRVGCTGIIDYDAVAKKYAELINSKSNGSKVLTGQHVVDFIRGENETTVITKTSQFKAKYIITTSGLQADRMAKKEGQPSDAAIIGFRGDYYDLTEKGLSKVNHLIYPVPNPKFPFLGVHFTRMITGGTECGPNAVFVFDREGYSKTAFNLKDTADAFSYKGTWKFFAKHWRFGLDEYRGAFSKTYFLNRLRKLVFPDENISVATYPGDKQIVSQLFFSPNLVYLTINGLYENILGIIDSLSFSIDDNISWATTTPDYFNGTNEKPYPTVINVSIGMKIIEHPAIKKTTTKVDNKDVDAYTFEYGESTEDGNQYVNYFTNNSTPQPSKQ